MLTPTSCHRPLDHASQQIRVLVVKPGRHDDAIQGSFAYTSLAGPSSQQTDFGALSYCWGDSPERVNIHLEAEGATIGLISVSPTIERALRRLRNPDTPLRIWIDAVCINQTDLEERAQQVSIMGTIYSRAKAVHIWLDEDNSGLDAALRIIRDVYNCERRVCTGGDGALVPEQDAPLAPRTLTPANLGIRPGMSA